MYSAEPITVHRSEKGVAVQDYFVHVYTITSGKITMVCSIEGP